METMKIFGVDIHDAMMAFKRAIEERKYVIHSPTTIHALANVKIGPDGRVDPKTVDSDVRATLRAYVARQQSLELEAGMAMSKEDRIADLFGD